VFVLTADQHGVVGDRRLAGDPTLGLIAELQFAGLRVAAYNPALIEDAEED
jgi:hypothetical protein